jgi:hypothetical protein
MSASTIKITFTEDLALDAQLGFDATIYGGLSPYNVTYVYNFVTLRSAAGQVTLGTPTANPGERNAINFIEAFELDVPGQYTVIRNVNEVTIGAGNFGVYLTEFFVNGLLAPYTNDPSLEFIIDNGSTNPFSIENIEYEESGTPCASVLMNVETTELAVNITSPEVITGNTDNPFQIEVLRGISVLIEAEDGDGNTFSETITSPPLLSASNFNIIINNSPNGATVVIDDPNSMSVGLNLEYSLDNVTWQTSNVFSGLLVDSYTLYVRDHLGCSFTKDFDVNEFGIYSPHFYISKANSIRFANRVTWGDSANYKTDENTLSCEVDVPKSSRYKEVQQFQTADIITTQFQSNFETNTATIIKADLSEVDVPVVKKTNYIGRNQKMDARQFDLGFGKTGIYFLSGNIYDFVTNVPIDTYSLNGGKPEWAVSGNYIIIGVVWFLIEDVVFDEAKNADVIIITNNYTGPEINVIVGSVYNRENYEVYEFTIDMVDYLDQYISVRINATDTHFDEIIHLSELIWIKVKHIDVLEIRYKNTTNTDILYSTGIEHLIRQPYIVVRGKDQDESEIYETDSTAILIDAKIYENEEFAFEPVTKEIWRKMKQALSSEVVGIQGIGYQKNGEFATEGPLGESNLYALTANMIKTGGVYNSQTGGQLDYDGSSVTIPALLSTEVGFVEY